MHIFDISTLYRPRISWQESTCDNEFTILSENSATLDSASLKLHLLLYFLSFYILFTTCQYLQFHHQIP